MLRLPHPFRAVLASRKHFDNWQPWPKISLKHACPALGAVIGSAKPGHPTTREYATTQPGEGEQMCRKNEQSSLRETAGDDTEMDKGHDWTESGPAKAELLDIDEIQRSMPLPTPGQYPGALPGLFNPLNASVVFHSQCARQKLSLQTEVNFSQEEIPDRKIRARLGGAQASFRCDLKVKIQELCSTTAYGEGFSKTRARQAAWLHFTSKMHVDGSLQNLFPSKDSLISRLDFEGDENEDEEPELIPVELDDAVIEEQRDAKAEIYDYAASLGLVPVFETEKKQQPQSVLNRRSRLALKTTHVWQVRIRLECRGIDVEGIGRDAGTAEIAAALAFKQEAEKQELTENPSKVADQGRILTMKTAKSFFEFYKSHVGRIDLTIECEKIKAGTMAQITMNGIKNDHVVIMKTKKSAEAAACLVAAIALTNRDPKLIKQFEAALRKGNGNFLSQLSAISIPVESSTLSSMRNALLEARAAGLPDSRPLLGAEPANTLQQPGQRPQKHTLEDLQRVNTLLRSAKATYEQDPELADLRSKRAALPMSNFRSEVLNMVSQNLYSIVVGATGSGKTTQVPQIIFEDAIEAGEGRSCNIVCTQPRRIAATSVAQRVASERNENLQTTVGYHVRFDAKPPQDPFGITYCTAGILLEKLKHNSDAVLETLSHICLDEVHERDLTNDSLMIVLKQAIKLRQFEGRKVPKIVLMSATLDSDMFARYFANSTGEGVDEPAPALSVPGRAFPVRERYLSSIMDEMREKHGSGLDQVLSLHSPSKSYLAAESAFIIGQGKRRDSIIDWKGTWTALDPDDSEAADEKEESLVPIAPLAASIAHICSSSQEGAILAFLPGLDEITEVQRILLEFSPLGIDFSDETKFKVLPLHSSSTKEQQAEIFKPLPTGCRKIILATNIAETSVTVTDVKYVVDSGKQRENRYDQLRRITQLQCVWVSKSSSKQRAGRAGRVQNGYYYALFSKERHEALTAVGRPELLRCDLQETCLSVKAQGFDESVASFLSKAMEPPQSKAIDSAVINLIEIEAFTKEERLTALGRVLSQLRVHPSLGKMIILGLIFRCLDPMILLGAAANERSLFALPLGQREAANAAHRTFAIHQQSDHLAFLEAFSSLRALKDHYGINAARQHASAKYLHWGAFSSIDQSARQIQDVLVECGLISRKAFGASQYGPSDLNRNAKETALIKGLLAAGLRPNISTKVSEGVTYRTQKDPFAMIVPNSCNSEKRKASRHPVNSLFTFSALAKSLDGNTLYMRDTTMITPLMAVLFGGRLHITSQGALEMDGWLPFFIKYPDQHFATKMILEFRKALERVLHRAFESLGDLSPENREQFQNDPMREQFVEKVVDVLRTESLDPRRAMKEAMRRWG